MKIYIAGPMTGLPDFNYPAFHAAAAKLRAAGYTVVSPAELTDHAPDDADYATFFRAGIRALLECDAAFFLPGWEESRGAVAEYYVARALGMDRHFQDYKAVLTENGEIGACPSVWQMAQMTPDQRALLRKVRPDLD